MGLREITVTGELNGMNYDGVMVEVEITVDVRHRPPQDPYFCGNFGNWLPGEPEEFDWKNWRVDGRDATPEEVREILNDSDLCLRLEAEARKYMD